MAELQCLPPTDEPRVTDHIEQIIDLITKIIDNGCGYTSEGDVYFSVENFSDYCCLSRRKLDANRAGGGGRVTDAEIKKKKNDADFALWKSAKAGEPSWESPWGRGRPGWHIECSAMSFHYLGHSFDIHVIVQILITQIGHWKLHLIMCFTFIRLFMIVNWHYHYFAIQTLKLKSQLKHRKWSMNFIKDFLNSMSDDLHTSIVLDKLENILKAINATLKKFKGKQQQLKMFRDLIAYEKEAKDVLGFLGLLSSSTCFEILEQLKERALKRAGLTKEQVQEKIEERTLARKNKEFKNSDLIRQELSAKGIALMDEPKGTTWRPSEPSG